MPSFREYNKKLQSLRSMRRVTRTMKMVAAGHLRRAQSALARAERYGHALRDTAAWAFAGAERVRPALATAAAGPPNVLLVVVTSDRGLCGGFNHGVARKVEAWIGEHRGAFRLLRASFIGRRGHVELRHSLEVRRVHDDLDAPPDASDALRISLELCALFRTGKYQQIHVAYTKFVSAMRHEALIEQLLPSVPPKLPPGDAGARKGLLEPDTETLANRVLARYVHFQVFRALLHSAASEHSARMLAMDSATGNVDKLATRYTLLRNTARQAAITRELIEIVSGAETLKGA